MKYEPMESYHKSKKGFKPAGEMGESKKTERMEHKMPAKKKAVSNRIKKGY